MIEIPNVRFSEYTDAWEQRKLGELTKNVIGGGTPKTEIEEYWNGEIPWIQSSNVKENNMFSVDIPKHISQKGLTNSAAKLIPANSIAVVTHVGVGKLVFMPFSYTTSQDFTSLSNLKSDGKFTCYALYKRLQNDMNVVQGSAIKGITKDDLLGKEIMVPQKEEQQKIGEYLFGLDHTIALHQRKCDALKQIKASMLQKMFPKNGENVPEVRFAGFTYAWEQRKLSDVAERYDNLRIPVASGLRVAGNTPYYGANGIQDYVDGYTHDGEYVLVAEDGANDLKNYPVNYVNGRVWVNNHAHVLQGKPNILNNQFLCYAMGQADIESVLTGGGRAKLNAEVMMNIELGIPSLEEQQKIGQYFSNLDNTIALHQRKCDALKQIKASMLQKMFPTNK